jgi:hypothetical protein
MEQSAATIGKLADSLAKAQGEFVPVSKNKVAKVRMKAGGEYSYHYADLADVLKMALPILAKHGLALVQPLRRVDGRLCLTSRLIHASGESLESDGLALPEQLTPQEFGSCLSYWRRYDACALLGIAPDEDEDGTLATEASKKRRDTSPPPAASASSTPPGPAVISEGQRKRLFAICKDLSLNPDALRDYIFKTHGFASTKDITQDRYASICTWLQGDEK